MAPTRKEIPKRYINRGRILSATRAVLKTHLDYIITAARKGQVRNLYNFMKCSEKQIIIARKKEKSLEKSA